MAYKHCILILLLACLGYQLYPGQKTAPGPSFAQEMADPLKRKKNLDEMGEAMSKILEHKGRNPAVSQSGSSEAPSVDEYGLPRKIDEVETLLELESLDRFEARAFLMNEAQRLEKDRSKIRELCLEELQIMSQFQESSSISTLAFEKYIQKLSVILKNSSDDQDEIMKDIQLKVSALGSGKVQQIVQGTLARDDQGQSSEETN